jgi:polyisoprenoid-binding protein YceI
MKIVNKMLLLAPLLFVPPAVLAQHRVMNVDPQASTVTFALGDVLHSVAGTFQVESGSVDFDPSSPKISGSVAVAAGSGKSGNDTRDKKMSKDILDASHFAGVTFVPTSYQGAINPSGDSSIQVTGTLTLHGSAHELTVPMQVHIEGTAVTAKTHFVVPYVKWGLKDPSTFILRVAKEVQIDLTLVGRLTPAG